MALVIACLVLLVVFFQTISQRTPPVPEPRLYIVLRQPRGELAKIPGRFVWQAVKGAAKYKVTISDEDAVWPLLVLTSTETSLELSAKEMQAITPGRIHIWEVAALGQDGLPTATGGVRFWVPLPESPAGGDAPGGRGR